MRRQFGYISKRCLIAIMTAGMVMSSAAASMTVPMTVCAEVLPDNPEGSETSIDVGDSMLNNFGTITNNFGTLTNNVGTVTNNNGTVANNYGTVTNTEVGEVTINHTGGTVTGGNVTDNYAAVNDALTVVNNYTSGRVNGSSDCHVTNNWGTTTDVAEVTNNMGTVTGETRCTNNYAGGTVNGVAGEGVGPTPDEGKATDSNPTPPSPVSGEKDDDARTPGGSGDPGSGGSGDPGSGGSGAPGNLPGAPEDPDQGNPPGAPEDQDPILNIINDALKDYDPNDTAGVATIDFGKNTALTSDALKALIDHKFEGCLYFTDPDNGTQYGLYFPGDKLTEYVLPTLENNLAGPVKIAKLLSDYGAGCAEVDKDGNVILYGFTNLSAVFSVSLEKGVRRISFGENPVKELVFKGDFKDPIPKPETPEQPQQTHNTVMGAEIGMAALSAGNEFIGAATEGLGQPANIGADGISSFASMGGGSMRQETG
ncbi:hypothetical protein SAMN02910292_02661 [Lachnospiraceae bacterium XBB2008]|nr:hypothetical protein SAMN02910292_02661 [Lachnospiraceae bacterium XBB2008]